MKKTMMIYTLLSFCTQFLSAQSATKPITVKFAAGQSDAALTKSIAASSSIDFIMNAKKGQTIGFTIGYDFKDSDIQGFLTEPGSQDISLKTGPKSPNSFAVNKTGNHRLTVHNTSKKKITMTLYIDIEALPVVTLNQKGDITLNGKSIKLENLRKELQPILVGYKVIPDKIDLKTIGQTGMGMRAEVQTEIAASIGGAKWLHKKAAMQAVKKTSPKTKKSK
jgi:hypothetical protein